VPGIAGTARLTITHARDPALADGKKKEELNRFPVFIALSSPAEPRGVRESPEAAGRRRGQREGQPESKRAVAEVSYCRPGADPKQDQVSGLEQLGHADPPPLLARNGQAASEVGRRLCSTALCRGDPGDEQREPEYFSTGFIVFGVAIWRSGVLAKVGGCSLGGSCSTDLWTVFGCRDTVGIRGRWVDRRKRLAGAYRPRGPEAGPHVR